MNLFALPKDTRIAPEQRTVLQKLRHNLGQIDQAGWRTSAAMAGDELELRIESEADPAVGLTLTVTDFGFFTISGPFIEVSTGSAPGEVANFLRAAIHTGVLERRVLRGSRVVRTEIHTGTHRGDWRLWFGSNPLSSRVRRMLPGRETVAARELRLANAIPLRDVPDPLGGERAEAPEAIVGGDGGALGGPGVSSGRGEASDVDGLADRIGLGG